jgi:hypothetical protein
MFRTIVVLALALGANARSYNPSISLKVTDTKLNGLGSLNLVGAMETELSDSLTVGAEYDYNENEQMPREVFARWSGDGGGGKLGVTGRLDLAKKAALASVSFSRGDTRVDAKVDSNNAAVVEEVELNQRLSVGGRALSVNPKWVSAGNVVSARARLELNDVTHAEVEGEMNGEKELDYTLRVSHEVNADNRVTPELNLKSGKMKYEWNRKLGGDNSLKTTVTPSENVELEWNDNGARGAWTTKVNVPWGNSKDSDISFARKFNF